MREVDVDLYEFLKEHETGLHRDSKTEEVIAYVFVDFRDLKEFQEVVGAGYFDEGGMKVLLQDGHICVEIQDIIEADHELESYKSCFSEYDWKRVFR